MKKLINISMLSIMIFSTFGTTIKNISASEIVNNKEEIKIDESIVESNEINKEEIKIDESIVESNENNKEEIKIDESIVKSNESNGKTEEYLGTISELFPNEHHEWMEGMDESIAYQLDEAYPHLEITPSSPVTATMLSKVQKLHLRDEVHYTIEMLSNISYLTGLKTLSADIISLESLEELWKEISSLKNLEVLKLYKNSNASTQDFVINIPHLPNLRELILSTWGNVWAPEYEGNDASSHIIPGIIFDGTSINGDNLPALEVLNLRSTPLSNYDSLGTLSNLKTLLLQKHCYFLNNIDFVKNLTKLEEIDLYRNSIMDFSPLKDSSATVNALRQEYYFTSENKQTYYNDIGKIELPGLIKNKSGENIDNNSFNSDGFVPSRSIYKNDSNSIYIENLVESDLVEYQVLDGNSSNVDLEYSKIKGASADFSYFETNLNLSGEFIWEVDIVDGLPNGKPTLSGLNEEIIKQGQSIDLKAGVFANDLEDGDITNKIVYPTNSTIISRLFRSVLDTTTLTVGTHELVYSITDSDGNKTSETRIIKVLTNNAPIIVGAANDTIKVSEVDTFDLLAGITINDDHDNLTSANVVLTGVLGKPAAGSTKVYNINYTVTDSDGNVTSLDRNITVTNEKPTLSGLDQETIKQGISIDLKDGVFANDLEDGDITNEIVYPAINTSYLNVGVHVLEYSITDSDGNKTSKNRTINVLINPDPIILGAEDITIKVSEVDTFDLLAGITVIDNIDNLTSADVVLEGTLKKPVGGTTEVYNINYKVTDSDGNITSIDRKITVTNQKPTLSSLTAVVIEKGQEFDLKSGVSATDLEDGDLTSKILYSTLRTSSFDVGEYQVRYSVTDSDGNNTIGERNVKVISQGNNVSVNNNDGSSEPGNNQLLSTGFEMFDLKIISFTLIALLIIRRIMFNTSK
ncbi:MAG: immunoglobulin-like domain-containing protein [Mycoplasmatales bacterium]